MTRKKERDTINTVQSPTNPGRRRFLKQAFKHTMVAGAACVVYPVLIERHIVLFNHYQIPVPNLPEAFRGYRIAHLTDIHYGNFISLTFLKGVLARVNQLHADAICLTGDYAHHHNAPKEVDAIWSLFSMLRAKDGIFAVLGNHDHWASETQSLKLLERSGFSVRHTCTYVTRGNSRLAFGGAGDFYEDIPGIDTAFLHSDNSDCRILLAHNPDTVDLPFETLISLTLSGHTHGGQVRIPFFGPIRVPVRNKRYVEGFIDTPQTGLFIARGIGGAVLPVRFDCYPEIAVLELIPTSPG